MQQHNNTKSSRMKKRLIGFNLLTVAKSYMNTDTLLAKSPIRGEPET